MNGDDNTQPTTPQDPTTDVTPGGGDGAATEPAAPAGGMPSSDAPAAPASDAPAADAPADGSSEPNQEGDTSGPAV